MPVRKSLDGGGSRPFIVEFNGEPKSSSGLLQVDDVDDDDGGVFGRLIIAANQVGKYKCTIYTYYKDFY